MATQGSKYAVQRAAKSVQEAVDFVKSNLVNKAMVSNTGNVAEISRRGADKLGSEAATKKSINPRLHAKAVVNIDSLFKHAEIDVAHNDSKQRPEVEQIHRLGTLMFDEYTSDHVPVMITMIEYKGGHRSKIYSVEVVALREEKTPASPRQAGEISAGQSADGASPHAPITEFNAKVQQILEKTRKKSNNNFP